MKRCLSPIRANRGRIVAAFAGLLGLLLPSLAPATVPVEWLLKHEGAAGDVGVGRNLSIRIAPVPDREYTFATNYNYVYELAEIASFLADWQLDDPDSVDHGGMIEAEAGDLGDVIQTDNTLEAIISWCRYGVAFGDTLTYGENVQRAWEYCWRFPAWQEEGAAGDDYYRNHNCAWGVWAATVYEEAYGDTAHASYAETCATYMVEHPMPFPTSGNYEWINQFVTGWMAGNLYWYAQAVGDPALADTAVGMGNRVRMWLEEDPETNLAEERWAMSSGTAVWGVCNSLFRDDPQAGAQWVATYGPMVDTFQPWRNLPSDYGWDNAWNVAYANAHHAMYLLTDEPQYAANFQALTDTLLSYDTDNDGGIPATTKDPVTEDMTWISSYLWLMGVYGVADHLPDYDVGVLSLTASSLNPPYHTGDSLEAACTFSNFGWEAQAQVPTGLTLVDPAGVEWPLSWIFDLDLGGNASVQARWPLPEPGPYHLIAHTASLNDDAPQNDTLSLSVDVLPVVEVTGLLYSSLVSGGIPGMVTATYLPEGGGAIPYDTASAGPDGSWSVELPVGAYLFDTSPRLPYPTYQETVLVADPPTQVITTFDRVADLVLVDDDAGEDLEQYVLAACDSLMLLARTWDRSAGPPPNTTHLLEFPGVPVVWLTGEATTDALTAEEQDSLVAFLDAEGTILLSGQNILEYATPEPSFAELFPFSFGGNSTTHILDFEPDEVLGTGYDHLATAGTGSAGNQRSQDVLQLDTTAPGVEAYPVLRYSPGQLAAARLEGGGGKRVFLGFGLEGVGVPAGAPQGFIPPHVFLDRCLAWLLGTEAEPGNQTVMPGRPVLASVPNPARGTLTLHFISTESPTPPPIRLYDCAGRLIRTVHLGGPGPLWSAVLDCRGLPAGMYLCRAQGADTRRVVLLR